MIQVTDVKQHLVGLGPWLSAAAQSQFAYDDNVIAGKAVQCTRDFERRTKFRVTPLQICSSPDGTYDQGQQQYSLVNGSTLLIEDGYEYRRDMAQEYFTVQLRQWPAVKVQRVRVVIGSQTVFEMPTDWYSLEQKPGLFSIQPVYGPLLISSLNAFSALEFTFGPKDYLRNCIKIDYLAGLTNLVPGGDWPSCSEWSDVYRCITQMTALQVLNDVAELADAGLASVSAGGDQRAYTRFEKRKIELQQAIDSFIETLTWQETPFPLGFV